LLRGDPAREIVRIARDEGASLIAMSTHCHDALYHLLLGSVTAKVLHHSDCPMWTHSRLRAAPASECSIRNVLCAVDLGPHSHGTAARAAQIATDFGARLTLVHVTAAVEIYGPGGLEVVTQLKDELVGFATQQIAKLKQDIGADAEVIIENGAVLGSLDRAVERAKSDLLVIGHLPPGGHLGANGAGYAIIRDSRIPVLSI
jgi:nucleotide-binding universal stress UspA family protein